MSKLQQEHAREQKCRRDDEPNNKQEDFKGKSKSLEINKPPMLYGCDLWLLNFTKQKTI